MSELAKLGLSGQRFYSFKLESNQVKNYPPFSLVRLLTSANLLPMLLTKSLRSRMKQPCYLLEGLYPQQSW